MTNPFSLINAFCPSCGNQLSVSHFKEIVCTNLQCDHPSAASALLNVLHINKHLVELTSIGFTTLHPIIERLDNQVFNCPVHDEIENAPYESRPFGRYVIDKIDDQWEWTYLTSQP